MKIFPIPIFSDNYVWCLSRGAEAVVVDPGDAAPVQKYLDEAGLKLSAILITHWHPDHIGGLPALITQQAVPVYGPRAELPRIPQLTHTLGEGDVVKVLDVDFRVMEVPGHTLGHIAFQHDRLLLCGDTLFSAGCGRLFEGTPEQMQHSLARFAALPDDTRVYCTHEYTASNLAFALAVEPDNVEVQAYAAEVRALRARNQPTLPSSIGLEKRINPFLRSAEPSVRSAVARQAGAEAPTFAALRRWKDSFKSPTL